MRGIIAIVLACLLSFTAPLSAAPLAGGGPSGDDPPGGSGDFGGGPGGFGCLGPGGSGDLGGGGPGGSGGYGSSGPCFDVGALISSVVFAGTVAGVVLSSPNREQQMTVPVSPGANNADLVP